MKPFAKAAENWESDEQSFYSNNEPLYEPAVDMLTVGHLRAARDFFYKVKEENKLITSSDQES